MLLGAMCTSPDFVLRIEIDLAVVNASLWSLWLSLAAVISTQSQHLPAKTQRACQIVWPFLLSELIGPPYIVLLSYNICGLLAINLSIVNLQKIEVRKSWNSHSSWALVQWLETENIRKIKAPIVWRWPNAWRLNETELNRKEILICVEVQ